MKVVHVKTGKTLGSEVVLAESFFERLKGLMFLKSMKGFDGMLIKNCNSVHNCFVRFSLDLVFVDAEFKIVRILRGFRPWRFSWIYWRARHVFEFPEGTVGDDIKEGDLLETQGV